MTKRLVPEPPADIARRELNELVWEKGRALVHVYRRLHKPTAFNSGRGAGRFHPIYTKRRKAIPTLYAAHTLAGAAMETVFRTMPTLETPRFVPRTLVEQYCYVQLVARRDLRLLPLWGNNLRRLGLVRGRLLEPGPEHYERTARWAEALHEVLRGINGLVWNSRQFDGSLSVVLFGDRVKQSMLAVRDAPICFHEDHGFQLIAEIAQQADITLTER
jgi:RES domain